MKKPKDTSAWVTAALAAAFLVFSPSVADSNSGPQTIPKEAMELHANVIASVPASARRWILEKATYVARTPGAENSAGFLKAVKDYAGQFPNGDIMGLMFAIFKESIEQANEDKSYYLGKLAEMNKIAEALGDYLKYLSESAGKLEKETDSDPVCEDGRKETRKGLKTLRDLQSRVPSRKPFRTDEPKTYGELKAVIKAAAADLKARDVSLKRSIELNSVRLQVAQARYSELFPKMTDIMEKVPAAKYKRTPKIK